MAIPHRTRLTWRGSAWLCLVSLALLTAGFVAAQSARTRTADEEREANRQSRLLLHRSVGDDTAWADAVLDIQMGPAGSGDPAAALAENANLQTLRVGHGGWVAVAFVDNRLINSGSPDPDLLIYGRFDAVQIDLRGADELSRRYLRRALGRADADGWHSIGPHSGTDLLIDIDSWIGPAWQGTVAIDGVRVIDRTPVPQPTAIAPQQLTAATLSGTLALGNDVAPLDVVGQELSIQVRTPQDDFRPFDVVGPEFAVQVLTPEDEFRPFDVISREISVRMLTPGDDFRPFDVISQELAVQVLTPEDEFRPFDVVSREVSLQLYDPNLENGPVDVVSRELSIRVPGGSDLRVISLQGPTNGRTDTPLDFSWFTRNSGNAPITATWVERLSFSTDGTVAGIVAGHDLSSNGSIEAGANRTFTLSVPAPSDPGIYFVLVQTDATDLVAEEYQIGSETNNLLVSPTPLVVEQSPRPALEVRALTPPRSATANESVELVWWTQNSGTAEAVGPWTESIMLGEGPALANPQLLAVDVVNGTLPIGASLLRVLQVTWPAVMPTDPWISVCTNAGGELILLPGIATCATAQVCPTCEKPDLVASTIVAPASAYAGESLSVSWTVSNVGNGSTTAPWTERAYLVRELDGLVVAQVASMQSRSLTAGSTRTNLVTLPIPPQVEGEFRVRVEVDTQNQLLEPSGETNNTTSAPNLTVVTQPPRPDLVVASAALSDSTATANELVQVSWSVSNLGNAIALPPWQDAVYLSPQSTFNPSNAQLLASYTNQTDLAASSSYPTPLARSIVMPPTAGTYWIFVSVDRLNDVEEGTAEFNNITLAGSIVVTDPPRPNLAVTSVVPAPAGPVGTLVTVTWTTVNSGAVGINSGAGSVQDAQWNERIYASPDAAVGGDTLLASSIHNDSLPAGSALQRTRTVPVPPLPAGYYIIVQLDPTNTVVESNESDNFGFARDPSMVVLPNLVTSSVTNPTTGTAEAAVTVSWTVTNTSNIAGANGTWIDTVYVRTLATGVAQPLGSVLRASPLGASGQYTASLTANLPGYAIGTHEVFVLADSDDTIAESSSTDNRAYGSQIAVSQPPRPNLIVEAVTLPSDDLVSRYFTATWRIRNTGSAPITVPFTDRVYAVDVATGTEYMLGFANITGGLAVDATLDVSAFASMPAQVGTYRLSVQTDRTNTVNEGSANGENDNRTTTTGVFHAETFVVTAGTAVSAEPTPAQVPINGQAITSIRGAPVGNVPIDVTVDVRGSRRTLQATTAPNGSFALNFAPLPTEAGHYELRSGPRGQIAPTVNDTFELYALTSSPAQRSLTLYPGFRATSTGFVLHNQGDNTLTGLSVQVSSLPEGLNVTPVIASPTIGPLGTVAVEVDLNASASMPTQDVVVDLTVSSAQGATVVTTLQLSIRPPNATIVAAVPTLRANVQLPSPGGNPIQTLVDLELTNIGSGVSQPVEVLPPALSWFSVATQMPVDPLLPGQSATVTLILDPALSDVSPGATVTGSIPVLGGVATTFVPFEFTAFQNGQATVIVRTSDEGTYWGFDGLPLANGPRVGGASVTVREYFSNQIVGNVTTGADGLATFPNLAPGYYTIRSQAPGHAINEITRLLIPGETYEREAFMPILGVSYTWNVVPTQIEDQYTISVNTTFQTFVPAPVVTIEPAYVDLDSLAAQHGGQPFQIDYTITNHGLIRANAVTFGLSAPSGFQIEALATELGDLAAGQSVIVPVVVTPLAALSVGGCTQGSVEVRWTLVCGIPVPYLTAGAVHSSVNCPPPPPPCSTCVSPEGGGGCSDCGGTIVTPPPPVAGNLACDPDCVLGIVRCFLEGCPRFVLACGRPTFCAVSPLCDVTLSNIIDCGMAGGRCFTNLPVFRLIAFKRNARCVCDILTLCLELDNALFGFDVPCTIGALVEAAGNALYGSSTPQPGTTLGPTSNQPAWAGYLGTSSDPIRQNLVTHYERVFMVLALQRYLYGADEWIDIDEDEEPIATAWMNEFAMRAQAESMDQHSIAESEIAELENLARPATWTTSVLQTFFARWNRTVSYWNAGITTSSNVPPGFDTDFIDQDLLSLHWNAAWDSIDASQAEGFLGIVEGVQVAEQLLEQTLYGPQQGVCATVQVQIDQTVTLTRSAFRASLGLENSSADVLEVVDVDIEFETVTGQPASHLFNVQLETIDGIAAFDGTASLLPANNASATWMLIPSNEAAQTVPVNYVVSGAVSFVRNGVFTLLPLAPITIEVLPNADLKFKYFIERDVYSDDPFTPLQEPAVPFDLGLRVENEGGGSVTNMSIASAQPEIVRNDSGLLIDFQIIGSQVGDQPGSPSLTVDLGDFGPGQTNTARWQLTSSLQGKFIGYEASVQNLNGLDDPEFWVIDPQVDVLPMLRAVKLDEGGDDFLFDFLAIDPLNLTDALPNRVWLSDGTDRPVSVVLNASVTTQSGSVLQAIVQGAIDPQNPNYIRITDPFNGAHTLTGVQRSDGKVIQLGPNAWQTQRVLNNGPSLLIPRIHLFDQGGIGQYTLTFEADILGPSIVGWASFSQYSNLGYYNLRIADDGGFVDPRFGGPQVLHVGFSEPIDSTTFVPANITVRVNTDNKIGRRRLPVSTLVSADGKLGSIVLSQPIPDRSYVCVTVEGLKDQVGNLMDPITDRLNFWTLVGDINGDGITDVQDLNTVTGLVGTNPIDPGNFQHLRSDVDRSGAIDAADQAAVQARLGKNIQGVPTACFEAAQPGG